MPDDTSPRIQRWNTVWGRGTLLAVACVAALNLASTTQKIPPPPIDPTPDMADAVVRHEQRFAELRENLHARGVRGVIGYLGDHGTPDDGFYYAQFALLPFIVDLGVEQSDWAMMNLTTSPPEARLPTGWRIEENFGDGVLLVRKSAP